MGQRNVHRETDFKTRNLRMVFFSCASIQETNNAEHEYMNMVVVALAETSFTHQY